MNNDLVVFMCPPYPKHKNPPSDHSKSELRDCPKCNGKMWLSDKKKGALLFASCLNKEVLLGCYDCIKDMIVKKYSIFDETMRLDI